jgi:hypothetical protein
MAYYNAHIPAQKRGPTFSNSGPWRDYPADTLPWCFLLAVIRPKISPSPAASCAAAALLDVAKEFFSPEVI